MKLKLALGITLALIATACGDEQNGKDGEGNCTSGYIDSWNAISRSADRIKNMFYSNGDPRPGVTESQLLSAMRDMDSACDSFLSQYRGVDCRAVQLSSGSTAITNPDQMASACSVIKQGLQGNGVAKSSEEEFLQSELPAFEPVSHGKNVDFVGDAETLNENN